MKRVTVSESVRFVDEREWGALLRSVNEGYQEIDGRIGSRQELLARIAEALGLEGWFGMNWDALDEALRDLETDHIVAIAHAGDLWKNHPRTAATLLEVWLSAAEELAAERVSIRLLFVWCDEMRPCCSSG